MSKLSSAAAHPGRGRPCRLASRLAAFIHWSQAAAEAVARAVSSPVVLVAALWGLAGVSSAAPRTSPGRTSKVRYGREHAGTARPRGDLKGQLERARKAATSQGEGPSAAGRPSSRERKDITLSAIDDQLAVMRALIEEAGPDDKSYPDYLFRYADLHLDRKAILDDQAGALYETIHELEEAGKDDAARQQRARQARLRKSSRAASEAAANAYGALVDGKRWASWKRMDEALYYYAFELGRLERVAQEQEVFVRLLRDHPTSRFVPQVYVRLGDERFEAGRVDQALELYTKVIDGYESSPSYAYAQYKSAWCHLNPVGTAEPDYARALQRFVDTVRATLEGRAGSEANGRQLRRDARRDLVLAYVHAGRPSKAWGFFGTVGEGPTAQEDMRREMMVRLAATYFGEGMYVESTATYHRLRDELPRDPDRCEWQHRVVLNALASDDAGIQWAETERLAAEWERARDGTLPKRARRSCRNHAHDTLQHMAAVWHDEGDKTRRPEIFELSGRAYAEFLRLFPEGEDAYEMHYWYGELLWQHAELLAEGREPTGYEQGRALFRRAHDHFVQALALRPKGKHSGEAAYAQMLAMKNALDYDETRGGRRSCVPRSDGTCVYEGRGGRRGGSTEPLDATRRFPVLDYDDDELAMLEAYARFEEHREVASKTHPEETPKILFHRAKLMVEHNRFAEARPVLERLLGEHDGTVYAVWGGEMQLDLLTIAWADPSRTGQARAAASDELETFARSLSERKLWAHAEAGRLREQVPDLLASVGWRNADDHHQAAKRGDDPEGYAKCARAYYGVFEEHDEHDRADELLFNAARCFEAAHQVGNAIRTRKALLELFPDSSLAKQTLREVGEGYHAIAFYDDAAERYEEYARRYGSDEFAGDALENAFLFRLGLGQHERATADLERYEALYRRKDPQRAAGIAWARHELLDDPDERLRHAEEFIRGYGRKGGLDRLVVAHATAGQVLWRRSCPKKLLGDVCVSVRRQRATAGEGTRRQAAELRRRTARSIPDRCGQATQGVVTVHRRDAKLAAAAQAHFERALALAGKAQAPADDVDRTAALRDAVGSSMVYRTDARYEDYLRIEMPDELDFHLEEWKKGSGIPRLERQYQAQLRRVEDTRRRFKAFFDDKVAERDALVAAYAEVLSSKSPHWVLASAARSAVVYQNFADQLHRAEVPRSIRTEEAYDDYCFGLADYAEPLQQAATEALRYCLERSTEYQYFDEFSRMCEEELQQREPDAYPATNEILGRSRYTRAKMDVVEVQSELEPPPPDGS